MIAAGGFFQDHSDINLCTQAFKANVSRKHFMGSLLNQKLSLDLLNQPNLAIMNNELLNNYNLNIISRHTYIKCNIEIRRSSDGKK